LIRFPGAVAPPAGAAAAAIWIKWIASSAKPVKVESGCFRAASLLARRTADRDNPANRPLEKNLRTALNSRPGGA
jgi:hypothetical protein